MVILWKINIEHEERRYDGDGSHRGFKRSHKGHRDSLCKVDIVENGVRGREFNGKWKIFTRHAV